MMKTISVSDYQVKTMYNYQVARYIASCVACSGPLFKCRLWQGLSVDSNITVY